MNCAVWINCQQYLTAFGNVSFWVFVTCHISKEQEALIPLGVQHIAVHSVQPALCYVGIATVCDTTVNRGLHLFLST